MDQRKRMWLEKLVANSYSNTTGIIVLKDGKNLYERYFNGYSAEDAVHVASVTKSVFSALIGIALEKGYIKSIEQKVLEFFPDYRIAEGQKGIQSVTIKHMLTMTAPYQYKSEPYEAFFASDNWINAALGVLGGTEPSNQFTYSAIVGTHILSGILVKATGQSVFDFAVQHLFLPLELSVKNNKILHNKEEQLAFFEVGNKSSGWAADPQGLNPAGWGLTLTPMDMAKIGQLYLNGGKWKGEQIVSKEWIKESTKEQSRCTQWGNLPYGYLWWIMDEKEHSYAALGDGGNVIYINEKKKLVVSISSLFLPRAKDRIKLIKEYIEPMFEDAL